MHMGSVTEAIGLTALSQKASSTRVLGSQSRSQNSIPVGKPGLSAIIPILRKPCHKVLVSRGGSDG